MHCRCLGHGREGLGPVARLRHLIRHGEAPCLRYPRRALVWRQRVVTGAPKLPEGKLVFGKVYAFNIPIAKVFPEGNVSMEYLENPAKEAKIYYYQEKDNKWTALETKLEGNKLLAKATGAGIFTALVNSAAK